MIAALILAAITTSPGPSPTQTIWCTTPTPIANPVNASDATYNQAERDLCEGRYAQARQEFASIIPYASKYDVSNGNEWIDIARGYFYSLIASGDDAGALTFLTDLQTVQKWQPHPADRLFWDNSPVAAFNAYAQEASTLFVDDSAIGDKNVVNAAHAMSSGDTNTAIADLQIPVNDCGACTIDSLQLLMLGEAYESQRNWPETFAAWTKAANAGHVVPEYDTLDEWNLSALEMIYYYRTHLPQSWRE